MREDGSSDGDEKWIDLGHLLDLWPMGHADGLDVGCEGKRVFRVSLGFGWSNHMEGGVFIYLEKTEGGTYLGSNGDKEFCLGKIKSEMSVRYPSRDVIEAIRHVLLM